ncbi:MAG TPA: VOC family protein [Desulfobacteraceae bacterium]|nr:VOC family protein [Deltaproteobacteria bacterium]MBW2357009.1 VOC family protein [Deltaproteobacteria bacterium]RLB97503.1 MAG: VOC family protein [Deltaproteobacteria bacterium]HDI59018.1 VOC family protein [Desulfobacteraceae bacterium]
MPLLKTANTILYCRNWRATVDFYQNRLGLPINFATDWLVEFSLTDAARLSIADQQRASVKSAGGLGITLALEVEEIRAAHRWAESAGLAPTALRRHPWNAEVFHLWDPEGHRIEFWQATAETPAS